jgi:hypothetical protein
VVDALLIGLIVLAAVLGLLDAPAPPRVTILLLAALLGPGGALLKLLPRDNMTGSLAVAVSLSLSIEIAGALLMAWARWWHPLGFALVVGGFAVGVLMIDLSRHRGAPR